MDEQIAYLATSAERNFAMWDPMDTGGVNGDERLPYAEAAARVKSIFFERVEDINHIFTTSW